MSKLNEYSCIMLKCHNNALIKLMHDTFKRIPIQILAPGENTDFNPHITILYGIYTSNIQDILNPLKNVSFVNYKTTGISAFTSNSEYDVLKIDVDSVDLLYLNKKCRHSLQHKEFYPHYKPHLTIAYIKKENQSYIKELSKSDLFKNLYDISHITNISTADDKKFNFNLQSKRLEQIK